MASQGRYDRPEPRKDPRDPSQIQLASNTKADPRRIHPTHPLINRVSAVEGDDVRRTDA